MAAASAPVWGEGRVTVYAPGSSHSQVLNPVKDLRQLVADPAFGQYQPGMVIAVPAATRKTEQDKRQTLNRLQAWAATEDGERAAAIRLVINQLTPVNVTGRQFASLDPDYIRNNDKANRTLAGEYSLYQASAPDQVWLLGPVSGAGKRVWQPGRQVNDYLSGHDFLSGAEHSQVTVIDPDGAVRVAPVDYWNRRHVEPQPGSIILVGFSSWALPGDGDDLNQQIINILTHRIPD
ncbi:capsule biosynthesis GfcC family protein [Enterobacter ludwigii]|nr:capsule biosynthesis GfcC family protein [Enterobacter ludwigii]WGG65753.1 capsule biosynthesis GfcC family protein [Enterobacter ludwigii]